MRGVWFEKNIDYENVSINEFVIMNLVLVLRKLSIIVRHK